MNEKLHKRENRKLQRSMGYSSLACSAIAALGVVACTSTTGQAPERELESGKAAIQANPVLELIRTADIDTGYYWQSAFYNPLTGKITLLEFTGTKYMEFNTAGQVVTPLSDLPTPLGGVTDGADFDPATGMAVVSNRTTPEFIELDPTTLQIKSRRAVSGITSFIHGISIRDNGDIYATDYTGPVNQVYSRTGTTPLRSFPQVPSGNDCITFIQGSNLIVTGDGGDFYAVSNADTGAVVTGPSAIGPSGNVIRATGLNLTDGLTALKKTGLYIVCNDPRGTMAGKCGLLTLKCDAAPDCPVTEYAGCDTTLKRCIPPTCGDGKREGGEACDDGNTTSGDGCGAGCGVEADYTCRGDTPSVCGPTDTDNDGLPDKVELLIGTDPAVADTDGDGLSDGAEVGTDRVYTPGTDTNPLDADTDDDGLKDGDEKNGSGPNAGVATNPLSADTDGDGIGDGVELGLTSGVAAGTSSGGISFAGTAAGFVADADPSSKTNPTLKDSDNDGLEDGAEDANRDGATVNTIGGKGTAGSGETDPGNADTDGDGLKDGDEVKGTGPLAGVITNPLDSDTDDGGRSDGSEVLADRTNPLDGSDDVSDDDGDGVSNTDELRLGTNPANKDTDGDGVLDNVELSTGATGNGPFSAIDTDGDGIIDAKDTDDDNDTILTSKELADALSAKLGDDVDGDGKKNWLDKDADADGIGDKDEPADANGNGVADYLEAAIPAQDAGADAGAPNDASAPADKLVGGSLEGGGIRCTVSSFATDKENGITWFALGVGLMLHRLRRRVRA